MFFTTTVVLILTSLLWTAQIVAEERRSLTFADQMQSKWQLNAAILFYFANLILLLKLATYSITDRTTANVELTVPLINYMFLKTTEPKITMAASTITVLLLIGGLNVPKLAKFASLESIYIVLGSIISAASGWKKKTTDSVNLYDYFTVGLIGLTVGAYIINILPWAYGLDLSEVTMASSVISTLAITYYNLKLFLSPVYLVKYVPITSVGNGTAIYVTLVTLISTITITIPLLIYLSEELSNVKLTGLFLLTATALVVYAKFQTLKDIVLLSSPLLSVPLLGTLTAS